MGRKRPTLGLLLEYLMKAELFRAADYLAEEILKVEAPTRPSHGPAVAVNVEEALAELLGRQDLNETAMGDGSDPSQINLSRVDYPMHLLETEKIRTERSESDNYAMGENDIGIFEMRCNQSRSHQVLDPARPFDHSVAENYLSFGKMENLGGKKSSESGQEPQISDLIKFSTNSAEGLDEKIQTISRSDLIKFDSAKLDAHERIQNEVCETMLPNFNVLRGDSSANNEQIIPEESHGKENLMREMSSSELPVILKEYELSNYFHRELTTSELPLCLNDRSGLETIETDFSRVESSDDSSSISNNNSLSLLDISLDRVQSEKITLESSICNKAFDSQELPVTVLEFQQR
ncbi:uncharacterized protein tub isoform X2 [Venturia canescens]|nr:uncharacterized protein LOC122417272 isoform X2 [Venturia canescens]